MQPLACLELREHETQLLNMVKLATVDLPITKAVCAARRINNIDVNREERHPPRRTFEHSLASTVASRAQFGVRWEELLGRIRGVRGMRARIEAATFRKPGKSGMVQRWRGAALNHGSASVVY